MKRNMILYTIKEKTNKPLLLGKRLPTFQHLLTSHTIMQASRAQRKLHHAV